MLTKIFFSFLGLPMIFNSMFNFVDLISYAQMNLIYNSEILEITEEDKSKIQAEIVKYLENSYDSPALAVTFPEFYKEMLKDGYFLNFKFGKTIEFNGMPFNEITIKVDRDMFGFNIFRGNDGVFQGRCIYINTENSSTPLFEVIEDIVKAKVPVEETEEGKEEASKEIEENVDEERENTNLNFDTKYDA